MPSAAERFLVDFHARHAGATTVALGAIPVRCGERVLDSSYHALVAQVPPAARRILDLACGDGYLLSLLAQSHPEARLAGADMSPGELAAAAARLQGRAALHQCRAQQLPYAGAAFDAVTCHMALMLMEDPPQVLAQLRRVTAQGGTLTAVLGAPLPASPAFGEYLALLRPKLAQAASVVPIGDRRWRTPDTLQALLEDAGYAAVTQHMLEGELRATPQALWDWMMLMYDAHFLDEATRASLREPCLAALAPHAGPDGCVRCPVAWRLLRATAP
jgi:ubiquinone/menaquinone biosynthesis C-methylase UbiE